MAAACAVASFSRICCRSDGSESNHFLLSSANPEDGGLAGLGHVFGGIPVLHGREHRDAGDRGVDRVVLQRRQHIAQGHRLRRRAKPLYGHGLKLRGEYPNLLALEIGKAADRRSGDDRGRRHHKQRAAVQALVGAETEHQLAHRRIGGEPLAFGHGFDEARRRQDFETFIDAGEEFRGHNQALDFAKLHALDLPLRRTQLARRINLDLDAAVRILLDRRRVILGEFVQGIVDGRQRNLHHIGLIVRRQLRRTILQASNRDCAGADARSRTSHVPTAEHKLPPVVNRHI